MHPTYPVTATWFQKTICQVFCVAVLHPNCMSFNFFWISKEPRIPRTGPISTTLDGAHGTIFSISHFLDEITMMQWASSEYRTQDTSTRAKKIMFKNQLCYYDDYRLQNFCKQTTHVSICLTGMKCIFVVYILWSHWFLKSYQWLKYVIVFAYIGEWSICIHIICVNIL